MSVQAVATTWVDTKKIGPIWIPFTPGVESSDIRAAGFDPTTPINPKWCDTAEIVVIE